MLTKENSAFKADVVWDAIYSENISHEKIQELGKIYKSIDQKQYSNIGECVGHAIEHENHSAFAKFFIEKIQGYNDVLYWKSRCRILKETIGNENWEKICNLIKSHKLYCEQCWINNYNYNLIFDDKEKGTTISIAQLKKYFFGYAPIPRALIIQIGVILQLDAQTVNRILRLMGYPVLYLLNVADAVAYFYLEKWKDSNNIADEIKCFKKKAAYHEQNFSEIEGMLKNEAENRDYFVRLYLVKLEINRFQKKYYYDADKGNLKTAGTYFITSENIMDRVEQFYKGIDSNEIEKERATLYLTSYGNKKFEEKNKLDLDNYFDSISEKIKELHGNHLNIPIRFGETKKLRNYLKSKNSGEEYRFEKYLKTATFEYKKNMIQEKGDRIHIRTTKEEDKRIRNYLNNCDDRRLETIIHIISKKNNEVAVECDPNRFVTNSTINMLYGRKVEGFENKKNLEGERKIGLRDKSDIVKYLIATGNEDELIYFLSVAGFSAFSEWNREAIELIDESKVDSIEAILFYALLYRDQLIDKWIESDKCENIEEQKLKYKEQFPFIYLLNLIARDIQMICKYFDGIEKELDEDRLLFPYISIEDEKQNYLGLIKTRIKTVLDSSGKNQILTYKKRQQMIKDIDLSNVIYQDKWNIVFMSEDENKVKEKLKRCREYFDSEANNYLDCIATYTTYQEQYPRKSMECLINRCKLKLNEKDKRNNSECCCFSKSNIQLDSNFDNYVAIVCIEEMNTDERVIELFPKYNSKIEDVAAKVSDFYISIKNEYKVINELKNKLDKQSKLSGISITGNDIRYIGQAELSLKLAVSFIDDISNKTNEIDHGKYNVCAGIAIVPEKNKKDFEAYIFAEKLCRNAKEAWASNNMNGGPMIKWEVFSESEDDCLKQKCKEHYKSLIDEEIEGKSIVVL